MPHPVRWIHRYTYEQYLSYEASSNVRHEYLDGEIYAMAGGTIDHAAMAANTSAAILAQIKGGPCRVFSSDLKVRVLAADLATYADVTVVWGRPETDPASDHVVLNPALLVEVTSPSSETWDRGEKLALYKLIPALRACVIVSHRARHIELHRREDDGSWTRHEARGGEAVALPWPGAALAVDDVYLGTEVPVAQGGGPPTR